MSCFQINGNDKLEGKDRRFTADVDQAQNQLATKSATSIDDISEADLRLGLLAYPVLQAADILLYK
jgi:tryptophanyl-tRNA synthetase